MTTEEITTKLREPFPVDVIEEKNGLSYIPHEIVRERLIEATGNTFDWSIDQVLFRDDGVTRRSNDRTGQPRRPLSMLVIGTLSIPGLGKRAGVGAHPLDEGAGEDAAYKSAESDAIKRAAMCFGVGLGQLYIETGEAKRNKNKPRPRHDEGTPVTMETHPYNPPRQWTPDASDATVTGTATQDQRRKMFAIAKSTELGLDEAQIKAELKEKFGTESSRELSLVQMNNYIRELEKRQAEARRKVNTDVPF